MLKFHLNYQFADKLVNISSRLRREGVTIGAAVAFGRFIPDNVDETATKTSEQKLL